MIEMFPGISPEIEQFVVRHIDSLHTLDVLLLLYRSPDRGWSCDEVHELVKSSFGAVRDSLTRLTSSGLLQQAEPDRDLFYYKPQKTVDRELTRGVDRLYNERHTAMIGVIYAKHLRETRSMADIFALRRRPCL